VSWLARHSVVGLSSISILELEAGVGMAVEPKRARLAAWLDALLTSGAVEIAPVDEAVARTAGRLRAARRATPVATEDLLLAATAMVRGWTLATRNVRHFQALGVTLVNPWAT
jgi:toxin FitB